MTASAKPSFGSVTDILDGVMVRLVTLTRGLIPPLMFYESGIPTIQANYQVPSYTCSGDASLTPLIWHYHWPVELLFGFWRTCSSLDPSITEDENTTLPTACKILFSHLGSNYRQDHANTNQLVVRA